MKNNLKKLILAYFATIAFSYNAYSANFYVNDNATVNDAFTSNTGVDALASGSSINPYATLKYAIQNSGATSGDTIFVDAGTYNDLFIDVNIAGLTIVGAGNGLTIFDNVFASANANWCMDITANNVKIQDLDVTRYNRNTGGFIAVGVSGVTGVVLQNFLIYNNASGGGDGALVIGANTEIDLIGGGANCNEPTGIGGGGVDVIGANIDVFMQNYAISGNSREVASGGGLIVIGNNTTTIVVMDSCIISDNHSGSTGGGGFYINGGNVTMNYCCITGNDATQGTLTMYGGGGYITNGILNISNSTIGNNTANRGAGICNRASSSNPATVTIDSCEVINNSGYGIYQNDAFSGVANTTVTNTYFDGNTNTDLFRNDDVMTAVDCGTGANTPTTSGLTATGGDPVYNSGICPTPEGGCYPIACNNSTPQGDTNVNYCSPTSAPTVGDLVASGGTGATIVWYDMPTGGSAYINSDLLVDGETYYASNETPGCDPSLVRLAVLVRISNLVINAGPTSTTICDDETFQLGGTPTDTNGVATVTFSWSPAAGLDDASIANPTTSVDNTTNYVLTVTDGIGCVATDSVQVNINETPTVDAGNSFTQCSNETAAIGGSPTGSGGTGTLNYLWSPGTGLSATNVANPDANPATTQIYTVTVTDDNGCDASDNITVTVNSAPTADAGPASTTICSDEIFVLGGSPSSTGGTPTITYAWTATTGLNNASIANPTTSVDNTTTYTLTVTDGNNCVETDQITVNVNAVPSVDAGNSFTQCSNETTAIGGSPTGSGGTGSLDYSWTPATGLSSTSVANPDANPAATQTYTVTVTDDNFCDASDNVTVTVNSAPIADAGSTSETICDDETFNIGGSPTGSGGTGLLSYAWLPVTGLNNASNANPSTDVDNTTTYFVTVTDAEGCSDVDSIEVIVNPTPVVDAGNNSETICFGDSIQIGGSPSASGGTGTLDYAWTPNGSLSNGIIANPFASPTSNETYTLIVTDDNGCDASDDITVNVNSLPIVDAGSVSETICNGQSVGLGASPSATGAPTLNYSWSPSTALDNASNANPNANPTATTLYTLTVTDGNNCSASDQINVIVNDLPVIDLSNMLITNTNCGNSNGAIENITATGAPTISYEWFDGTNSVGNNADLTGQSSGTYNLVVTDGNNCVANAGPFGINDIGAPNVNIASVNIQPDTCGQSVGEITGITITGGVGNLVFEWTDPSGVIGSSIDLNNVPAGSYTLVVTDTAGCSSTSGPFTVGEVLAPTIDISTLDVVSDTCGQTVGSINDIIVNGGTPTYSYEWTDGTNIVGTNMNLTAVSSGSYFLTVTDAAGCQVTGGAYTLNEVSGPSLDEASAVANDAHCGQSDGSITGISAIGGTGSLTYSWSNGTSLVGTSLDLTNVPAGTYILTVTDAAGCQMVGSSYTLNDVAGPNVSDAGIVNTPSTCGATDGSLAGLVVSGGTGAYTYNWSDGINNIANTLDLTNVGAGSYTFTVTDAAGCSATAGPFNVANLGAAVIDVSNMVLTDETCTDSNGNISGIIVSGGTGNLSYEWTNGIGAILDTVLDVNNLPAGDYLLTVTDDNGCSASAGSFTLNDQSAALIDVSGLTVNDATCSGSNGEITGVFVTGGTGVLDFDWSDGTSSVSNQLNPTDLAAGNYVLTVTDSNGCVSTSAPIAINDLSGPQLDLSGLNLVDVSCNLENGMVTGLSVVGGTAPVSISWDNGSTTIGNTLDLAAIPSGNYNLTIIDDNGCTDTLSVNIGTITPGTVDAQDDFESTDPAQPVVIDAYANDQGEVNTVVILTQPANGTVVNNNDGTFTYTPNAGFEGIDAFTYQICDEFCNNICDEATVTIDVSELLPINIPNGFSPNGDGTNDFFEIVGLHQYPDNNIKIFNRWGDLVYASDPYNNDWDGTSTNKTLKLVGNKVVDGTYFFILDLGDGSEPINGFVELRTK